MVLLIFFSNAQSPNKYSQLEKGTYITKLKTQNETIDSKFIKKKGKIKVEFGR